MKKVKPIKEKTQAEKLKEAVQILQEVAGIKVTRSMICRGVFAKPNHIFYIAKSKAGVEIRYEIETELEKDGTEVVIREIINRFPKHAQNVN